jgi:hypothetical protein
MTSRRTSIREWLLLAGLLLAAGWSLWIELRPPRGAGPPMAPHALAITATPLPGAGTSLSGIRLSGALALASDDPGFGGLSGLAALPDGRLLAVSDAGQWLRFRPVVRGGKLMGVTDAASGGLPAPPGGEKYDMDSEAVRVAPDGRLLVSFEQQHRILIYDGLPPRRLLAARWYTPAMRWLPNGGGEALALLPDGAMLWLPEYPQAGAHRGLFIAANGAARQVRVAGLPGMAVTDAVALDDGRVLLLHRRYTGVETVAALSLIDVAALPSATARPLLRWDGGSDWPIDNMEGLALTREQGRAVLYVVSDDNFSAAQRTLLLRLELPAGGFSYEKTAGGHPRPPVSRQEQPALTQQQRWPAS